MRNRVTLSLVLAFVALSTVLTTGCQKQDPADSSIPWGRPAGWEDRVPGMGDF